MLGKVALLTAVLAAAVGVAACGSSHHVSASRSGHPPAADTIVIKNFAFSPATLTVGPGAIVTVHNDDSATHTVTATGSSKPFDTGNVAPGASATFTAPSVAGSYTYICRIHQFMHGTLVVR